MKSIEFSEDQLNNLDELAKELFDDCNDPKSTNYIRKLNRPKIAWLKIILCLVLTLCIWAVTAFFAYKLTYSVAICMVSLCLIIIISCILLTKKAVVCAVKIYQHFAPLSIRNKCRFEPSCSEYMLLSLEKYGLIKGLKKGIDRLKRCNTTGGGFDYP